MMKEKCTLHYIILTKHVGKYFKQLKLPALIISSTVSGLRVLTLIL